MYTNHRNKCHRNKCVIPPLVELDEVNPPRRLVARAHAALVLELHPPCLTAVWNSGLGVEGLGF